MLILISALNLAVVLMNRKGAEMNGDTNNNGNKIIVDTLSGIKSIKIYKKISKYDPTRAMISEAEKGKAYVEGQGIVEIQRQEEIVLTCGHPKSACIGHLCSSGHIICVHCIEKHVLACIYPGCFKRLCIVPGCNDFAIAIKNAYACREHRLRMLALIAARVIFTGTHRTDEWFALLAANKGYNLQIHERADNGNNNSQERNGAHGFIPESRQARQGENGNMPRFALRARQ